MKKWIFCIATALCLLACAARQVPPPVLPEKLVFQDDGFTIKALEKGAGNKDYSPLIMTLPPEGGFSPNVNVRIQLFEGSLQEYLDFSLKQFEKTSIEVVAHRLVDGHTVQLEYRGEMQGRQLHWYAIAKKSGNRVILVTATASEEQWSGVQEKLRACVDSLELLQ